MKFSHKVKKAFRPSTYTPKSLISGLGVIGRTYRTWQQRRIAERIERRRKSLTVENLMRDVDKVALEKLRRRCAEDPSYAFWVKYLEIEKWIEVNIRHAHKLGLVGLPPRSVLDLGCGGGFFLAVCRELGAHTVGLDMDKDVVLNEMIALLKIRRIVWRIRPFVKLPNFRRKFDLITGFMICFNFPGRKPVWGPAEWHFFLNDLIGYLRSNGRVFLALNKQEDGLLYNEALRSFFESRGALIDGKNLTFTYAALVRTAGIKVDTTPVPLVAAVPAAPAVIAG